MKELTDNERSRPLTISIPTYMYNWMKQNLRHGEASVIMRTEIGKKMEDSENTKNKYIGN